MEPVEVTSLQPPPQRKTLHSKRSFGKYPRSIDSPAYDASEEDNDPLTDSSSVSIPVSRPNAPIRQQKKQQSAKQHQLASSLLSDSDGVDSPTYDGDIESTTTAISRHLHHASSVSTLNTPIIPSTPLVEPGEAIDRSGKNDESPVFLKQQQTMTEPPVPTPAKEAFNPASLTVEDIQAFVQKAIDGEEWRKYKINPPPTDRPIRIYADGVYDLFHFAHALQLRQAKLSFPNTYLLVGVCSDTLVRQHKSMPIMTHAERLEAVRHCRWVDEVVPDAPWVIDQDFLDRHQIDYVAHDEDPYVAMGHDDVYAFVKGLGKFLPTRRTPGVSTSELLERIVSSYRKRDFDEKLTKMGHAELRAEGSDYDDLSRSASPNPGKKGR